MKTKKRKVSCTFLNKNNVLKSVNFKMDEQLYKDIMTLPEVDRNYWFQYYYHEYEKEKYHERKYEILDEEKLEYVSSNKIQSYEDDTNLTLLMGAIALLEQKEKQILNLYYFEGFTQQEIANELSITKQAVGKYLNKIIKKIKKLIKK